jgi:two-component system, sensor histidine kinase
MPETAPVGGASASDGAAAADLQQLRLGQARLLHGRTAQSCLIVQGVIVYLTALILYSGQPVFALIWFLATSGMVIIVYLFARMTAPQGVFETNLKRFLRGHVVISGLTGLVWSSLAIAYLDTSSVLNLFIAINMIFSITVGGMLPSAEFRPSFVSLASCCLVPFSAYWLIEVDGALRLIGLGLLIYYGFGLLVSARAEVQTVEALAAERNRRLSEQLHKQNQKVAQVSAEKTRFLAAASHDMSQPLQAQGFLVGARRGKLERPDQIELLDRMEACWRSQQNLLQGLVETARIDSGGVVVKPVDFQLSLLFSTLAAEMSRTAADRSIALNVESLPAFVHSDPLLVGRILRNLLSNALKFTPAGGTITLRATLSGDRHILAEVTDTGPGIPADQVERIFEEYVQLEPNSGDTRGLGLGLSIVRQLAERLDAPLSFDSAPGSGTRAGLVLPIAKGATAPVPDVESISAFVSAPLIVLIEDDPTVRESLSILLTGWSCRVIAVESGAEALELIALTQGHPDLLLADRRLKHGEDGLDAILSIRSETGRTVPAILLTGEIGPFPDLSEVDQLFVLPKPANSLQLYRGIRHLLAQPEDTPGPLPS